MKIKQFIFVLLVQLYNILGAAPPLKCWLEDSQCLIAKAQAISPILAAGVFELDMQPLDTVVIDYIHIDQEIFMVEFRSMIIKGLGDAVVDSIRVDMSTKIATLIFHTDLDTESRYINNGTLLSTFVHGYGNFYLNFENVQITMNINFEILKDLHGKHVMNLESYNYIFDVKDGAQFYLENLYNGDKKASDKLNRMLNKNWKFMTTSYGPYMFDRVTEKIFYSIRNFVRSKPIETVASYAFK